MKKINNSKYIFKIVLFYTEFYKCLMLRLFKKHVLSAKLRSGKRCTVESVHSSKASFSGDVMLETFVHTAKGLCEVDPGPKI